MNALKRVQLLNGKTHLIIHAKNAMKDVLNAVVMQHTVPDAKLLLV